MNNKNKAIVLMIISVFYFSAMQLLVKLSGGRIPVMQQVFFRNLVTLILALLVLKKEGAISLGSLKNQPALFCRSIMGFIGVWGYFYASRNMLVADATLLHRSSPFFVIIFSAIFLKNRITKLQIFALTLSLGGAIIVINPQLNSAAFPAVIALISAIGAGAAYTTINYLKGKENSNTIVLHFSLISCVFSLLLGARDFVWPVHLDWFWLFGIGIFAAIGQYTLTNAYTLTNPGDVSIFNYLGIVFSGVLGFLFLDESMSKNGIVGMVMILTAAFSLYIGANYHRKKEKNDPKNL